MINEGKIGRAIAMGLLATQSTFGQFYKHWSDWYQTSSDPAKERRAISVLKAGFTVPPDAKEAIEIAVYIFEGDEGHSAEEFREYLEKTGAVETNYETKVQIGGGPGRSYWQVEPKTAMSLVKNSSAYFGPKFNRIFGEGALELLQALDEKQWSKLLEEDTILAATMAAAKWLETPW